MKKNTIILTGGLSGSSVLTSLIARAGYWTGDNTFKKADYDTYENDELIRLNKHLFEAAGYKGNYMLEFSSEVIRQIASVYPKADKALYNSFLQKCNEHSPWIWKDPRLWLTIRFWGNFLDLQDCKFILLTRDNLQSWISSILRRQILSYDYNRNYNEKVNASIIGFFKQHNLSYLHLCYEDLILHPREAIAKLNNHLNLALTVDDLEEVYNKPLYKRSRSLWDLLKAVAIYSYNHSQKYKPRLVGVE